MIHALTGPWRRRHERRCAALGATLLALSALLLVALALLGSGCAGVPKGLQAAHEGIALASRAVEPLLAAECLARARACRALGKTDAAACPPLLECRRWKQDYAAACISTHESLAAMNRIWWALVRAGGVP
jgi:hypothetical protein